VSTVGVMNYVPDLVNVVPDVVTMTVDLRNTDEQLLQQAEAKFRDFVASIAEAEGVEVESRSLARFEPVDFDPGVIDMVEEAATTQGRSSRRLPSGAGHDAQMFARVCPTAMVFVPSVNGISHNVTEYTEPEHIEAGGNVLLQTLLRLTATEF
jgi:N-carbamoyl-L-amino-acid hydrolase